MKNADVAELFEGEKIDIGTAENIIARPTDSKSINAKSA